MRTIYLISRAKTTGPINQANNILIGLKNNGRVDSSLVTLAPEDNNKTWLNRFIENDINVYQMNQPLWKTWCCIYLLRKYIKENNIDVVHSSGFRATFVSLFAGKKVKKVITQRCHPSEIVEKFPSILQPLFTTLYMRMIKRMDAIVACSNSLQHLLFKDYGMNVYAVQNGVNTDVFTSVSNEEKIKLRKELGLSIDKKIYLVLGSLRDRKNNKLLVSAAKFRKWDNIQIVIVGDGPEKSDLIEMAGGCQMIKFTGRTSTPLKYLQASDILVSCSLAEGLPNTVLEALACGLPVILSDIGPHKELIEGTQVGLIFDKTSQVDLCQSIDDSLQWDIVEKGKCARQIAVEKFSLYKLAQNYEIIYKNMLNVKY